MAGGLALRVTLPSLAAREQLARAKRCVCAHATIKLSQIFFGLLLIDTRQSSEGDSSQMPHLIKSVQT